MENNQWSAKMYVNINSIIYTKVAISFPALYNSIFAQNMVVLPPNNAA
jgi:hypothetical protein